MFLSNYKALILANRKINPSGTGTYNASQLYTNAISMKDTSGNIWPYIYPMMINKNYNTSSHPWRNSLNPSAGGWSVRIGDGTTEALISDYRMEHDITGSFSGYSTTIQQSINSNNDIVTNIIISGKNNTNSSLTISEIGVQVNLGMYTETPGTGNFDAKTCLIVREIIEPFEVPSNGTFTLTLQLVES